MKRRWLRIVLSLVHLWRIWIGTWGYCTHNALYFLFGFIHWSCINFFAWYVTGWIKNKDIPCPLGDITEECKNLGWQIIIYMMKCNQGYKRQTSKHCLWTQRQETLSTGRIKEASGRGRIWVVVWRTGRILTNIEESKGILVRGNNQRKHTLWEHGVVQFDENIIFVRCTHRR